MPSSLSPKYALICADDLAAPREHNADDSEFHASGSATQLQLFYNVLIKDERDKSAEG